MRTGSPPETDKLTEESMTLRPIKLTAAGLFCAAAAMAQAQSNDPLGVGRQMLEQDNPGDLWIDKGKALFHERRGR